MFAIPLSESVAVVFSVNERFMKENVKFQKEMFSFQQHSTTFSSQINSVTNIEGPAVATRNLIKTPVSIATVVSLRSVD